jgi:hypothetical protein
MKNIKFHISIAFGATEKKECQIEEECPSQTAIGIPIPKKTQTELRSGFGNDKNLGFGFGFGIPQEWREMGHDGFSLTRIVWNV